MIERKSWEEFRDNGMLWFINSILHLFGYAIVYEFENGEIKNVFPARVKFRGFSEENNTKGYQKISKYLQANIDKLVEEAEE